MYDDDLKDSEIKEIIEWGIKKNDKSPTKSQSKPLTAITPEEACAKALAWLDGFEIDEADLWDASQIRPGDGDDPSRVCHSCSWSIFIVHRNWSV